MFYYIKIKPKSGFRYKALRENGKILVFNAETDIKTHMKNLPDMDYKVKHILHHPLDRKSQLHKRKIEKVGW